MPDSGECWPILRTFQAVDYQVTMETFLAREQDLRWLVTQMVTCGKAEAYSAHLIKVVEFHLNEMSC